MNQRHHHRQHRAAAVTGNARQRRRAVGQSLRCDATNKQTLGRKILRGEFWSWLIAHTLTIHSVLSCRRGQHEASGSAAAHRVPAKDGGWRQERPSKKKSGTNTQMHADIHVLECSCQGTYVRTCAHDDASTLHHRDNNQPTQAKQTNATTRKIATHAQLDQGF